LNDAKKQRFREEAEAIAPLALPLRQQGLSLRAVCDQLNAAGVRTRTGKPLYAVKLRNLLLALEPTVA
jgi:hypothetical protein